MNFSRHVLVLGICLLTILAAVDRVHAGWMASASNRHLFSVFRSGDIGALRQWLADNRATQDERWHQEALYDALMEVVHPEFINEYNHAKAAGMMLAVIESRPNPNDTLCHRLLPIAVAYDYNAAVRNLVDRGIDVERREGDAPTVLALAGSGGNVELVRLLLKHGADPKATFVEGEDSQWKGCRFSVHSYVRAHKARAQELYGRSPQPSEREFLRRYDQVISLLERCHSSKEPPRRLGTLIPAGKRTTIAYPNSTSPAVQLALDVRQAWIHSRVPPSAVTC